MAKREHKFDSWYTTVTSLLKGLGYQGAFDKSEAEDAFDSGKDPVDVANTLMDQSMTGHEEQEDDL